MEIVPIDLENLNLSSEFIFFYFKLRQSKSIKWWVKDIEGMVHWWYYTFTYCVVLWGSQKAADKTRGNYVHSYSGALHVTRKKRKNQRPVNEVFVIYDLINK